MAIRNYVSHAKQAIYKNVYTKMDYSSPTHIRPNTKSLGRNISNIMTHGSHRRLRYLQLKYQHLHDRDGNRVCIGESMYEFTNSVV
jgi:hypothetical protein